MVDKLCKAGLAVKCAYKRNVKPYVACAFTGECIDQVQVTKETHGSILIEQMEKVS